MDTARDKNGTQINVGEVVYYDGGDRADSGTVQDIEYRDGEWWVELWPEHEMYREWDKASEVEVA